MTQLPTEITVFGQIVRVKVKKFTKSEKERGERYAGFWDKEASVIVIDGAFEEDRQHSALFHGVIDAISDLHNLDLSTTDARTIAQSFYTVFRDCALVLEWITPLATKKSKRRSASSSHTKNQTEYVDVGSDIKIISRP